MKLNTKLKKWRVQYHAYINLKYMLFRIRNCLQQLNEKDVTPDDKQELDEALQREVNMCPLQGISSIHFQNCPPYIKILYD